MTRPLVSLAALRDIDDILEHLTREAGQTVASKYRRSLLHLFDLLGDHPALGSRRPHLGRGVRLRVIDPYLVLYRHEGEAVIISPHPPR